MEKSNAKVDSEKVKEVKLMIETLKNFMENGKNTKGNKSGVKNKVAKSSSSKLTSLPAGPVGTIKIEISEMDLLNKNWLAQIEQSQFPLVFLRPLSKKLLEKHAKSGSESPVNVVDSVSVKKVQKTKSKRGKGRPKTKSSSKNTKLRAASCADIVKDIVKKEVVEILINDEFDATTNDNGTDIKIPEDPLGDIPQETSNNNCSVQNNESILPSSSSIVTKDVKDKLLESKDNSNEEIPLPINSEHSKKIPKAKPKPKPKPKRKRARAKYNSRNSRKRKKVVPPPPAPSPPAPSPPAPSPPPSLPSASIPPVDVMNIKKEEDINSDGLELSDSNEIRPEDIMANCVVSFVEGSLPIVLVEPLSKKAIEEAVQGLYIVEGEMDNEDLPPRPKLKRKAREAFVTSEKKESVEQVGPNKPKKKKYSIPPYPARVLEENYTMYKCSLCPYKSKRLEHMKNHLVKHSNAKMYKCSICDYESNKENNLQWHMLKHPGTKDIEMLVPNYNFISEIHDASDVGPHSIIEAFVKVYKCSVCRYTSDDVSLVDNHLASHPAVNYTDVESTENNTENLDSKDIPTVVVEITPPPMKPILSDDIKLTPLVELPKQEEEELVEELKFTSPFEDLFIAKINEIGEPKNEVYKCFTCPKCSFKTHLRGNLVSHIASHLNSKLHICLKCDFETNYKFVLIRHNSSCKGKVKMEENAESNSVEVEKNIDDVDMKDLKLLHEINLSKLRRDFNNSPEVDLAKKVLLDQSSSQNKLFKCFNCPYESRYKFILRKHISVCHYGEGPAVAESSESVANNLTIEDCFASRLQESVSREAFTNVANYPNPPDVNYGYEDINVAMEDPRPVIYDEETSCTMCSFQAETRDEYLRHLQSHYNYRLHQCLNCDFKTNYNYILTQHMSKCPYKEEVLMQPAPPENAIAPQRMYECPYCKFISCFEDEVKSHAVIHLGANVNPPASQFRCSECNFVTHRKATFSRHMNNHSNITGARYVRNGLEQNQALNYVDNTNRYSAENSRPYQSQGEVQVENNFSSYLDTPESIGANDEHEGADNSEGHATYNSHTRMMPNRHDNVYIGIHNL